MTPDTVRDATSFFDELARRGHESLLQQASGTLRFDVTDSARAEHWLVTIDKGALSVSHKKSRADCTVRADRSVLDGIACGTVNAMAAFLRGAIAIEGDLGLFALFQRLLPGPASTSDPIPKVQTTRSGA